MTLRTESGILSVRKKGDDIVVISKKPSVFFVGKKKPDAPPIPQISKEKMEKGLRELQKDLPKKQRGY